MTQKIKKGEIIKVISGCFKGYYGSYIKFIPKEITTKNFDFDRIKIRMYGKDTTINLPAGDVRKFIPKCNYCQKILNLAFYEISSFLMCKDCRKAWKDDKHFHYDKQKWLKKPTEMFKELMRRERELKAKGKW